MNFFYGLTPFAHTRHNPLFQSEISRAHWGSSARSLVSYTWRSLVSICIGLILIWLPLSSSTAFSLDFTALLFVISILAAPLLDYVCMSAAVSSISDEISAGRWTLMRLTALSDSQIVAAKHGIAQIRTWRLMNLIVALRAAVALMAALTFVEALYRVRPIDLIAAIDIVFLAMGYGWIALILALIYVMEPYWRMGALTALGVAISSRVRQSAVAIIVASFVVLLLWLTQALIGVLYMLELVSLLPPLIQLDPTRDQTSLWSLLFFLGLLIPVIYGFYALLQSWCLRHAEIWIAQVR